VRVRGKGDRPRLAVDCGSMGAGPAELEEKRDQKGIDRGRKTKIKKSKKEKP